MTKKLLVFSLFIFFNSTFASTLKFNVHDLDDGGLSVYINQKLTKYNDSKAMAIEFFCHDSDPRMDYSFRDELDPNKDPKWMYYNLHHTYEFVSAFHCLDFATRVKRKYKKSSSKKYQRAVCVHFNSEDDYEIYYDLSLCD
jgi:hypothetical protein